MLPNPPLFWGDMFALGLGSGCTAGFGALLAELFPTEVRNSAMGRPTTAPGGCSSSRPSWSAPSWPPTA